MQVISKLLTVVAASAALAGTATAQDTNTEFRIDSDASWMRILAYPDGPLKRFGHHHVISHNAISGSVFVAPDPQESTISLQVAAAEFGVDEPAMRGLDGEEFEGEVPQKDIDGTRANMLGDRLLNEAEHPVIRVESRAIQGSMPDVTVVTSVFVAGAESTVSFPASVELTDDAFIASGQVELTHDALGLSPFTAMGGALSVRDALVFKYEIRGTRVAGGE